MTGPFASFLLLLFLASCAPPKGPGLPTDAQILESLKVQGGYVIGVTNSSIFVLEDAKILAYKRNPNGTCSVRVSVRGHLTEPLVSGTETLAKDQPLQYENEYDFQYQQGVWKILTTKKIKRVP